MNQQIQQLWDVLIAEKLVQGEIPPLANKLESPWYVKVLLGISGWIASSFFLGFLGFVIFAAWNESLIGLFMGVIIIGIAFALLRVAKNEFVENLALSLSLAGQALLVFFIFIFVDSDKELFWILVTLLQVVLVIIIPNFIHRVFSSFAATCCFSVFMMKIGLADLSSGIVLLLTIACWLNEFRFVRLMSAFRATGYGLVLSLVLFKASLLYSFLLIDIFMRNDIGKLLLAPWISDVLIAVVMLYLVWNIVQRYYANMFEIIPVTAMLATLLLSVASIEMPGLNVGIAILLLGFTGSNRVLTGIGICSLLFFISSYYYFIDTTLMEKAQSLLVMGIVLIIMRWLLLNVLTAKKVVEHA